MNKLGMVFQNILNECNRGSYDKAYEQIKSLKPSYFANMIIHHQDELDTDNYDNLKLFVDIINSLYENTSYEELISDEIYSKLVSIAEGAGYSFDTGSTNIKGDIVYHKYSKIRGTVLKTHFIEESDKEPGENRLSIEKQIESIERRVGHSIKNCTIRASIKFDGVSGIIECDKYGRIERILPRGNVRANESNDISKIFKDLNLSFIRYVPDGVDISDGFGVQTEMIINDEAFKYMKEKGYEFKSKRAAVSGITHASDYPKDIVSCIEFIPLRIEANDEVYYSNDVNLWIKDFKVNDEKTMREVCENYKEIAADMGYAADGVVFTIMDKEVQEKAGRDENKGVNRWEFAYKFPPEVKSSMLLNVEFSIGKLGDVTPVAKLEPVIMKGNQIKSISLGSMARFRELNLKIGQEVKIKYDVIPYLFVDDTCDTTGEPIEEITRCIHCDKELTRIGSELKCTNPKCKCRIQGKIYNYCNKMLIDGFGESTIEELFEEGILTSIMDLYRLEVFKDKIINLDGWGETSFNNLVRNVNKRLEVYDYEMLGSLGIPSIGREVFSTVLQYIPYKDLIDMIMDKSDSYCIEKIVQIRGIGVNKATALINGIRDNYNLICYLEDRLKLKKKTNMDKAQIVFTNVRDNELEKQLMEIGYEIKNSVTKKTTCLIVPDRFTGSSSKLTNAQKYNIPVYEISRFKEEMKNVLH